MGDLSNNICSLCCRLQPRDLLGRLPSQDKFLSLMLGATARTILACPECRDRVDMFQEWWLQWRENLERLKQVQAEQNRLAEQQQPDTTCDSEDRLEISLTEEIQEERSVVKTDNVITIMKLDISESEENNIQTCFDDHVHHYFQSNIQNMPLNLVRREIQDTVYNNKYQSEPFVSNLQEDCEEVVSPLPSGYNLPILIPSIALHSKEGLDEPESNVHQFNQTCVSQDERRKHRNREASRRYREKARGDPELLKKMREQQNKRQKKYYARLKEKKQGKQFISSQFSLSSDEMMSFPKSGLS